MKNKSKNMKKGLSLGLIAMMVLPTTTSAYSESTSINAINKVAYTENITSNVLNQMMLSNQVSTAKPAKDPMKVYTGFATELGNSSNAGDGSIQNPYNRFEDAVAQVADGGTIYILESKGAFLNDRTDYGNLPFLIDKNVMIKPTEGSTHAKLTVRAGGILLGADVKFENISLSFENKYHDSIFANGHRLDLINVTRTSGSREIDLFAGGLYDRNTAIFLYPSGSKGIIHIETNDNFSSDTELSTFGNIYAGSMNGVFNGNAEINIVNNGKYKKLDLGAIKSSGALEADAGNWFDLEEPSPPVENPDEFSTFGDVTINLHNYQLSVDGTTGTTGETSVTTSTVYPSDLDLKNIHHLTVEQGDITAVYKEASTNNITIPNVTLNNGATLDLTKAGKEVTVENYEGDGIVTLSKDGKLHITDSMNGNLKFQTENAFGGKSGKVAENHVYLTTPNNKANISFEPHSTQANLKLIHHQSGSIVEWEVAESEISFALPSILDFSIEPEDASQIIAYNELNVPNKNGGINYNSVYMPFTAQFDANDLDGWVDLNEYPLQITVNGKEAVYRDDNGFLGPHYFAEDLDLAINFESYDLLGLHDLAISGYTVDSQLAPIKEGSYEIQVTYIKEDGTVAEFISYLTVTKAIEQNKGKASSIHFGPINSPTFGDTLDVSVSIKHDLIAESNDQSSQISKAYLYVNGKEIAEKDVIPSQQSELIFANVEVTTANNFKLGNNEISVIYSGSDTYNGSIASYSVEVAPPTEGETEPSEPAAPTEGETELSEPAAPTEGETELSESATPTEEQTAPSVPTYPTEGETNPIKPTPSIKEETVKEVEEITSNVEFLSKEFGGLVNRLFEKMKLFGDLVEQFLSPETLEKVKEIETKYEKMKNLLFDQTTPWEETPSVTTPRKPWKIKLSQALKNTENNLQFIGVVDMFGDPVDVSIKIDGKEIIVAPNADYVADIPYTLVILPGLESEQGVKLQQGTHLTFTFK